MFPIVGDFQWPKMRISAEEWHENTRIWLEPDDQHLLYIATDETDRDWFSKWITVNALLLANHCLMVFIIYYPSTSIIIFFSILQNH